MFLILLFILFMFILMMISAVWWAYEYGRRVGWHEYQSQQYHLQRSMKHLIENSIIDE